MDWNPIHRIKAIKEASPPESKAVRSFLGMTGYLSKCIPRYSSLPATLRQLTHKDTKFKWARSIWKAEGKHYKRKHYGLFWSFQSSRSQSGGKLPWRVVSRIIPVNSQQSQTCPLHKSHHDFKPTAKQRRMLSQFNGRRTNLVQLTPDNSNLQGK